MSKGISGRGGGNKERRDRWAERQTNYTDSPNDMLIICEIEDRRLTCKCNGYNINVFIGQRIEIRSSKSAARFAKRCRLFGV